MCRKHDDILAGKIGWFDEIDNADERTRETCLLFCLAVWRFGGQSHPVASPPETGQNRASRVEGGGGWRIRDAF